MSETAHYADSEVGRLQTVMLHRPGPELKRLTPRNNDRLLFDGIPWVARAQEEHDAFAETLRGRGVEVLYLTDLLTETFAEEEARALAITSALGSLHLGDTLRRYLTDALTAASPDELTTHLTAGIRNDEVEGGFGLVTSLLDTHDFLIDPLPNLLFTRDSSRVDPRPGRDHLAGDACSDARDAADRADLHPPSTVRGDADHPRLAPRTCGGWRRIAARSRCDRGRRG
jgi:arginine deiminase